jgi:hypothetical protein
MMVKWLCLITAALALAGCYEFNNPVDPGADNYQGFPSEPESPGGTVLTIEASRDTYIDTDNPNENEGSCSTVTVSSSGGDIGDRRILLHFDISAIPPAATITAAQLRLTKVGGVDIAVSLDVYLLRRDWVEGAGGCGIGSAGYANWTFASAGQMWGTAGGDYEATALATTAVATAREYTWSAAALTTAVSDWHEGITSNYGLVVGTHDGGSNDYIFASREDATATSRPHLVVTYTE